MKTLFFAAFAALIFTATSASAQVVTLEQLRAKALQSRPELAVQDARIAGARARIDQANAPSRPTVAGRVEATASPGSELITVREDLGNNQEGDQFVVSGSKALGDNGAFAPQFRYSARVGINWNIWDFGRTDAAAQAARAEMRARQAEAAQTREALVAAVDEVYLEWLGTDRRAALEAETVGRLDQRLKDLQAQTDAGGLAPSALLPIEADLAAARLRQSYADGGVELARLAVAEAIGQPLSPSAQPDPRLLTLGTATASASSAVDRQDKALAARIDAARATARLHDKRNNPQLRASASAGLRGQFDTVFPFYAAVVGIEFPMYDGGDGAARAAAARADAKALDLQRQKQQTDRERRQTREQLQLTQARQRVQLAETLVRAADVQLADVVERYREAAAGPADLSRAQAQQVQARAQLLTAKLDRARAALAVAR